MKQHSLKSALLIALCVTATLSTKVLSAPINATLESTFNRIHVGQLLLPRIIYAAPGQEVNVYFDNVVLESVPGQYLFDVTCAKGAQQESRWTWTPTDENAGDYPLQIEVRDRQNQIISTGNTIVRVAKANAGASQSIKMLCIGDSLTAASVYTAELLRLCADIKQPSLTLLGTTGPGGAASTNRHEGYGGWRYGTFLTKWVANPAPNARANRKSSPFLFLENGNPTLDFTRYLKESLNGQTPDFITIMLGTNDVFSATEATRQDTVESMIENAIILVTDIRAAAPHAKIAILPPVPPSASQDAFGANYKNGQTRWGYRQNQFLADMLLMQVFGNRNDENLFIVPAYANLDCQHNFPRRSEAVNARNDTKIQRASNGVHPATAGYLQIADSIFGWMKSSL